MEWEFIDLQWYSQIFPLSMYKINLVLLKKITNMLYETCFNPCKCSTISKQACKQAKTWDVWHMHTILLVNYTQLHIRKLWKMLSQLWRFSLKCLVSKFSNMCLGGYAFCKWSYGCKYNQIKLIASTYIVNQK